MEVCATVRRLAFLATMLIAPQALASGAKAIFYDEGGVSVKSEAAPKVEKKQSQPKQVKKTAPAAESYLGLSYWIDLIDAQGNAVRTTTTRTFQSGDRIKLNLQSNRNGYLYVIGLGSSGTSRVLFPNAEGVANGIKAKVTYAVPFDSNLRFDDRPGEEKLLVLLSQKPVPYMAPGKKIMADQTRQLVASSHAPGAKDLVLEEEVPEAAIEPATYAVVPLSALDDSGTLSLQIKLKHK